MAVIKVKKMMHKIHNLRHFNKVSVLAIVLFAIIGTILLFRSHAATPFASVEPEQGTKTANATVVSDTTASGGSAVKFGALTAPQTNNCAPNPSLCGFPDATNTGVPAGTALTLSGGLNITTAGTIIDAKDITDVVIVSANNVTIKRSRIRGNGFAVIRVLEGVTGFTIQDSEIDGLGNSDGNFGMTGPGTVLRTNIHNVENGIDAQGGPLLVQDSWIHNLLAPGLPHYDGIQNDGGTNLQIRHNTIDTGQYDQTASIMNDNYFGPVNNVVIDNNLLAGGGFVVYVDNQFNSQPMTDITITNNRFGRSQYGYGAIKVPITQSGNVQDTTGQPITL